MSSFISRSVTLILFGLPVFAGSPPSGIRNFDQVDTHVYRGGQPTGAGFQFLAKIGVKTVVDLREAGARAKAEERMVTDAGMTYVNVPMSGFIPPTEDQIKKILNILEGNGAGSVFVHCRRGADRTGAVIAAYHMDHDRWNNSRALEDANAHGMSPFQFARRNYIRTYRVATDAAKAASPANAPTIAPALAPLPVAATN